MLDRTQIDKILNMQDDIVKNNFHNLNKTETINFFTPKTIGAGLQAGALMGIYLLVLGLLGLGDNIGLKFAKYIILFFFLGFSISQLKATLPKGELFKNGILKGMGITVVSGFTLFLIDLVAYLIDPNIAFQKFFVEPDGLGSFMVINGAIFFELIAGGLVITFIWLQYYKSRKDYSA